MKDLSNVIFITDLDGTLPPSNKRLNGKDMEAVSDFRKFYGRFSIATGRAVQSASQYFRELDLDEPIIVLNGGGIFDCRENRFVWQKFVDKSAYSAVKDILTNFPKVGAEIDFSEEILVPRLSIQEEYHIDISYKKNPEIIREADIDEISGDGWCKALFAADEKEIDRLVSYVEEKNYSGLTFVRSSKYFYEILPNECSKGEALKKMMEIYHRNGFTVAACGDFDNDLDMLRYADIPIAPANAVQKVKNAAVFVTNADCDNGAVAEALYYVMNVL